MNLFSQDSDLETSVLKSFHEHYLLLHQPPPTPTHIITVLGCKINMYRLLRWCLFGFISYKVIKRIFGGDGSKPKVSSFPRQDPFGHLNGYGYRRQYTYDDYNYGNNYRSNVTPNTQISADYYESTDSINYEYQTISIYPNADEISNLNNEPELKQNIISGCYESVYSYLDIQFRLLREDFLRPLRRDICSYLADNTKELQSIQLHNIIFFRRGITLTNHNCYCLNIKETITEVIVDDEKRFMTGSILIFTNDNFRSIFCGKVVKSNNIHWNQLLVNFEYTPGITLHTNYLMVEYSEFFEPYYNVLKALQSISRNEFPMKNYIISCSTSTCFPRYLCGRTFTLTDNFLNESQLNALNGVLSEEFALIQGPPGTGKTHVARKITELLLDRSTYWYNQTPMLILSCTNHALDQFLEGVLPYCNDVLRMGGQSQNPNMKQYEFKQIKDKFYKTENGLWYKREFGRLYYEFKKCENQIADLEYYIDVKISGEDTDKIEEFESVVTRVSAIWNSNKNTCASITDCLDQLICNYEDIYRRLLLKDRENTTAVMRTVKIIGMTTTCASRMRDALKQLKCPIVIVEEAAEVLESHIVACLTQYCQHLILIGDHLQLKPSTASNEIGSKYNLEVSLFERMVNNGLKYHTLNVQHRMRPEISRLITPSIYPVLHDHPSVRTFPPIRGLLTSVYFIDHQELEGNAGPTSRENLHEVKFFIQLALYFVRNNYKPEDITILAGYSGQVAALISAADPIPELDDLLITSVDNFQGNESKIVLLSLVRNNRERRIGFLKKNNRVCVALSRAREGLIIMGNARHLAAQSQLWRKVKAVLRATNSIGTALPLRCHNHNTVTNVRTARQLKREATDGGCSRMCSTVLSCGHRCQKKCHINEMPHDTNCSCL